MGRAVLGVILGYTVWTVLWLLGKAVFFAEAAEVVESGQPYTATGGLVGVIALSIICSLASGFTTARIAGGHPRAVLVMAGLLLATGIAVQARVWALMPTWYHVLFLVLIVPVALIGGRMAGNRHQGV
jgi:hypothetical protein